MRAWAPLAAIILAACVTAPRLPGPPGPSAGTVIPGFDAAIRVAGEDPRVLAAEDARAARTARLLAASDGSFDILSLSGGGAGGAYGAGVLTGLTDAGERPQFEIVTGVSTGALIAPFAFLGSEWDAQLEEAYTGELAAHVLRQRGIAVFFEPSLYRGEPLTALVDHYVTEDLLAAVAREYARGRLLYVATTNLDTQESVLWDMGLIASRGGEEARVLFRDVLVASASVPGVFPPG